jgi:large subunit ribosomal protein L16
MIKNIKYFNKKICKRVIYRKGISSSINNKSLLSTGDFGIVSLENGNFTKSQLECIRIIMKRFFKKGGSFFIKSNFNLSLTSKSSGVRMGKGRGSIIKHNMNIKMYQCLIELIDVSKPLAIKCLKNIIPKLPFRVALIDKNKNFFVFVKNKKRIQ